MSTKVWRLAGGSAIAVALSARLGPLPKDLLSAPDVSTVVVDRHGSELYEARTNAGTRSLWLDSSTLPSALADATVAAEDRRFYRHLGIDPIAIVRATRHNLRARHVAEGGSTITQQAAKLLLDRRAANRRRRGLSAKIEEAIVALRLEHRLTKREILTLYLNLAPYGNQVIGASRASQAYFGVSPSLLTVAQAAFLAGLPQRPSAYNPYRDSKSGIARQRRIIDTLLQERRITIEQANVARHERLQIQPYSPAFVAPHFVDMVLRARASTRQARIETTLDASLQATVGDVIRANRRALDVHGAHNVAVVVLDNSTSEWLAWEGSGNYFDADHGGTIDGAMTLRQPGSALKPFVYALGFETGDTPATILPDIPASFPTAQAGIVYTPRNYDGRFHGPLRMRQALAGSQNVPAVALASRIGVPEVLRFFRAVGFTSFDKTASYYGLGVALGNAEVTLAEMVAAYAALARGGVWQRPRAIRDDRASDSRHVLSRQSAFWVTDILSDDEARAYVFGRGGNLEFPFPVAVKTGTSQGYRDNWTIGYTREVTVGVWVGNFDRTPLIGSSGVTGAGPIFHTVMLAAQRRVSGREERGHDLVERPQLVEREICALSGMRAGAACPIRVHEWLPASFSPLPCSWHHDSDDGLITLWPEEYRVWAASRGLLDEDDLTGANRQRPGVDATPATRRLVERSRFGISNPPAGATYMIDPTLRPEFQTLSFRVLGATGDVQWRVDGAVVGHATSGGAVDWPLKRGEHLIRATDRKGQSAEVTITVK